MNKKGIAVAGNMIVDLLYPINGIPKPGELTTITADAARSIGGFLCNDIVDLAKLDPTLPLVALGRVGDDDEITKQRTFYHNRGGNAKFCEADIPWDELDVDMLMVGYILLLDTLDEEDSQYGTKMAKVLAEAQKRGIKTSIDVVSEAGDRFRKLVCPALKYTDYCIINEVEASASTGIELRTEDGKLLTENMPAALKKLKELGVSTWAVIHCPEIGMGLDENNNLVEVPSLKLPAGWIAGTVGAGDAFCSGVLYGAWKGMDLKSAIELGTASAACSLSQPGATEGLRTVEEAMKVYNDLR